MKNHFIPVLMGTVVFCLSGPLCLAENANSSDTVSAMSQGITSTGATDARQAGQNTVYDQPSAYNGQTSAAPNSGLTDAQKTALKSRLGTDAIDIQTELLTASDQVKGLKAELDTFQNSPDMNKTANLRSFQSNSRKIADELSNVTRRFNSIQQQVKFYPQVAYSDDFKSFSTAYSGVKNMNAQWQAQVANTSYWANSKRAMSDLNELQKRLDDTYDKAKGFSSSQLDVGTVG